MLMDAHPVQGVRCSGGVQGVQGVQVGVQMPVRAVQRRFRREPEPPEPVQARFRAGSAGSRPVRGCSGKRFRECSRGCSGVFGTAHIRGHRHLK